MRRQSCYIKLIGKSAESYAFTRKIIMFSICSHHVQFMSWDRRECPHFSFTQINKKFLILFFVLNPLSRARSLSAHIENATCAQGEPTLFFFCNFSQIHYYFKKITFVWKIYYFIYPKLGVNIFLLECHGIP